MINNMKDKSPLNLYLHFCFLLVRIIIVYICFVHPTHALPIHMNDIVGIFAIFIRTRRNTWFQLKDIICTNEADEEKKTAGKQEQKK